MTAGERKALLFLAGIGVLGAGARLVTSPAHAPTHAERVALAGQLQSVDSARGADRHAHASRPKRPRRARRDSTTTSAPPAPAIVDLDVADSAAIEALPGIGPALAHRIVEERAAHGAFGSLDALQQVRGVGPKLAARIAPNVTFSGPARPARVRDRRR